MKRTYFDNLAERWDSLPGPQDAAERVERFVTAALSGREQRILDVGSGTGILLDAVRRRAPQAMVVECDFSEAMLRAARGKGAETVVCADAGAPPFAAGVFDAVLCFGVVPHLPDLHAALGALLECVRKGGRLAVGHAMGSAQLNALHAQIGGPVASDVLPEARTMAELLSELGAAAVMSEESPVHYLAIAAAP